MPKSAKISLVFAGFLLLGILLYQIPAIHNRLAWRLEVLRARIYSQSNPLEPLPTPARPTVIASPSPRPVTATATLVATQTPTATPVPLPPQVMLPSPKWEAQSMNNCGPAALTMALRMFGWDVVQSDIDKVVKPEPKDRNVNPEELRDYIRNLGLMSAEFRVGGDLQLIKRLLAADYPVLIEAATPLRPEDAIGPADDMWSAHYLLITGYDDTEGVVIAQDPLRGPDKRVTYEQLMEDWRPFNHVYMVIYLAIDDPSLASIVGADWDADSNRTRVLAETEAEVASNPDDAFAWFNLGSNLVYFERYQEAAQAYDQAITLGLPQRMTRYQFGPFHAYFHADRIEYLLEITEKTYSPINGHYAEEALLWHGYGLWRNGDINGAIADWRKALQVRPGYADALYALIHYGGVQP